MQATPGLFTDVILAREVEFAGILLLGAKI